MDRKPRWRDRVKATPYISPLQTFSSTGIFQESKQKFFQCPVCLRRYLEQEELPKKLPCDHVICLLCYNNIQAEGVNHCPICQVQNKFIRKGLLLKPNSDVTNSSFPSSFDSNQSLDLSETSLEIQRDQTDCLIEDNLCHEHRFNKLDLYCNIHDIPICYECEREKHSANGCTVISLKKEMKRRKLKAEQGISSKDHLMTKLNLRLTEFLDTLQTKDISNNQDVDDQVSAVNGLLQEIKVKKVFLDEAKREIEKQDTWENVLSVCGDAELKILYIDNSLKDMYTKLEVIKLHYTVRQQMGYGESSVNNTGEKLEHEEENSSSNSKSRATENNSNSKQLSNNQINKDQKVIKEEMLSKSKSYATQYYGNSEQFSNIKKKENPENKDEEDIIITNISEQPDGTDGSMSKIKHKTQVQIIPLERDGINIDVKSENSQNTMSLNTSDIKHIILSNDLKSKFKTSDKENTINKSQSCDESQDAEKIVNLTHRKSDKIKIPLKNELNQENKYKPVDGYNQNSNNTIKPKLIDTNSYVDSNREDNIFKSTNKTNDIIYNREKGLSTGTQGIESITLLKKLVSHAKMQNDMKMSEVNKLTVCLIIMFILSCVYYFMFARENRIIKDDLSKSLSQKVELENFIAESLSELNVLQHKLDETISQRDFFHLKLNEALIMQGKESEIQEIQELIQIQEDNPSSWFSRIGCLLYDMFYFVFRRLILTGSFIILAIGGEKLSQDYIPIDIASDSINNSISMVIFFLFLYEICGIVTKITTIPLGSSPLFSWYQPDNLFIVGGMKMIFNWSFAYSTLLKWLSTALVGLIVLALCVYIMSEISEKMKSHGVDKQNHDTFFIITWPIMAVVVSIFLVWLSVLPLT